MKAPTQAEADREYIEAVHRAPIIDGGSVRNARRLTRGFTVSEWQREARNRVCPHCGEGLAVIDDAGELYLACNNGHEMEGPDECPHHLEMQQLEGEALETAGASRVGKVPVADDMNALFGRGG